MTYLYLGVAILAEVVATNALKASDGFSRLGPSALVVLGYALSFWFLALSLRQLPVGVAYALWSGLGIVLITLVAALVFGERPNVQTLAGMALIIAGVVIVMHHGGGH